MTRCTLGDTPSLVIHDGGEAGCIGCRAVFAFGERLRARILFVEKEIAKPPSPMAAWYPSIESERIAALELTRDILKIIADEAQGISC